MKHQFVAGLFFAFVIALLAGHNGYKVKYGGGSLSDIEAGTELKMYVDATQVRLLKDNAEVATIPASAITEISYGPDVYRRVGTPVSGEISTSVSGTMRAYQPEKQFVAVIWWNANQKRGLAVQCDENDYRGVLGRLEGITGRRAISTDHS